MQDNLGRATKAPRRERRSQCLGVMLQTCRRLLRVTAPNQKPSERSILPSLNVQGKNNFPVDTCLRVVAASEELFAEI